MWSSSPVSKTFNKWHSHGNRRRIRAMVLFLRDHWCKFRKISQRNKLVLNFYLYNNYPNPFNISTTFPIELRNVSLIKVYVYNVLGMQIDVIADNTYNCGHHQLIWQPTMLSSGTYFAIITIDNRTIIKKLTLIK